MSSKPLPEPERWSERARGTSAEDIIGASLRRFGAATEPSDAAAAGWARRAMLAPPRAAGGRVWSIAIAALILGGGGTVAARVAWRAAAAKRAEVRGAAAVAARAHAAPVPRLHALVAAPAPVPLPDREPPARPAPAPVPSPHITRVAPAHRLPALPTQPPAVAVAAAPAAAEPDETALLASAFRQLREGGDAAGALAALDERERRFGAGVLASEATLARAEALLRLGRTADALPLLLALSDTRAGLTPEVRATRAELLARSNRCDEAAADFDMLIAAPGSTAARERALYGRAACRLQGGRPDAALPDLQRYLADYPDGRFAPAVRSALQSLRRP